MLGVGVIDMFGFIISGGKMAAALVAIAGGVALLAKLLWGTYRAIKRVEKIVQLTNNETLTGLADQTRTNAAMLNDIKRVIGNNGGASIFQRLSEQDANIADLKGAAEIRRRRTDE